MDLGWTFRERSSVRVGQRGTEPEPKAQGLEPGPKQGRDYAPDIGGKQ